VQFRASKIIYFFSNLELPKKMTFTASLESSSSASKPNCSGAITSKHSSPSRAVATDFFVFVDNSNVYLGAQHMDGKMNHAVRIDIDRLVKQIEQERFCVVRHVCGSNEQQPVWAKWRTNKYDVHIAQQKAGKEEGVDASLHSVIYSTITRQDIPMSKRSQSVIVFVTGDGNTPSAYMSSFPQIARTAVGLGWRVEVQSWQASLSREWTKLHEEFPLDVEIKPLDPHRHNITFLSSSSSSKHHTHTPTPPPSPPQSIKHPMIMHHDRAAPGLLDMLGQNASSYQQLQPPASLGGYVSAPQLRIAQQSSTYPQETQVKLCHPQQQQPPYQPQQHRVYQPPHHHQPLLQHQPLSQQQQQLDSIASQLQMLQMQHQIELLTRKLNDQLCQTQQHTSSSSQQIPTLPASSYLTPSSLSTPSSLPFSSLPKHTSLPQQVPLASTMPSLFTNPAHPGTQQYPPFGLARAHIDTNLRFN
jgi:hypothetical protein